MSRDETRQENTAITALSHASRPARTRDGEQERAGLADALRF